MTELELPDGLDTRAAGDWAHDRVHSEAALIRTARDVDALLERARSHRGTRVTPIVVAPEALRDADAVEAHLNREAAACGCDSAAVASSAVFLAYACLLLLTQGSPPDWGLADLLWGSILTIGAAVLGKALGLLRARRRWLADLDRLRTLMVLAGERGGD